MTEVRVVLGVLGVLLLVGLAAGCGLVSDQTKQEAKKKVEAKGQQVKQEVKKKVEAKGQEDLNQKVDDLQKKVEDSKEDLAKKLDDVQKDVNDLEKKVDELLKKVGVQEQQDQKK